MAWFDGAGPKPVHHIHRYFEPPNMDPLVLPTLGGDVTLFCRQADCYAAGLVRDAYPPEKIGPKLRLLEASS